ncbi:hypothetical protein OGATHE_001049 [Ogataea polymorpha]|uniref:Uncharacterized protein n=1 Tax=Ogataea polymorpha TaxID=460523 RepID=A0A9P8PS31_9ASCO|nr:hypothetical protein OGATHE_001049 [Ogataea polymorpha]
MAVGTIWLVLQESWPAPLTISWVKVSPTMLEAESLMIPSIFLSKCDAGEWISRFVEYFNGRPFPSAFLEACSIISKTSDSIALCTLSSQCLKSITKETFSGMTLTTSGPIEILPTVANPPWVLAISLSFQITCEAASNAS